MAVHFVNHETNFLLKKKRTISNWIKEIVYLHNRRVGSLTIIFTSDPEILQINKKFLKHNYFTDVITFDYSDGELLEGDIFISLDTVLKNSKSFNTTLSDELLRVMIHGVLHLLGFDDATDLERRNMHEEENKSLEVYYSKYE